MATKHVPIRTCIATGEKKSKNELMRFVLTKDGNVVVDPKDRIKGRGANLTMTLDAFDMAIKKRAFERALKLNQTLGENEVKVLRQSFEEAIEERNFRKGNQAVTIKIKKNDLDNILNIDTEE